MSYEDEPFHEPFGPQYVRPPQADCPNCPCCTAVLCERGRASLLECAGHVDSKHKAAVERCPCSAESTRGTLAWRAAKMRAVVAATDKLLPADTEALLRSLAAGQPLTDPAGLLPQLTARRYVTFEASQPVVTEFGRTYLQARTEPRTATPVLVQDVDQKARTARVIVVGYSTDTAVTVPMDQLANGHTALTADQLPGKVLHAEANTLAGDPDDLVLSRVRNPQLPPVSFEPGGFVTGLLSTADAEQQDGGGR
ncbi:hypothetical protein ACFCYB_42670 [Streptomyces sp. NPDC056309]|uniref:hypothetical protein n=1 Tax=unclassified Streptomyces TaxID=2593676 RepID=UPI0035DA241E